MTDLHKIHKTDKNSEKTSFKEDWFNFSISTHQPTFLNI